ncbi:hypothetical protein AgCh_035404 [Apium graveolens]
MMQAYIVYMGDRLKADLHGPSIHRRMVEQVLGSNTSSSLLYSYTRSFNGFVAKLSSEEMLQVAAMNGVVSVFPNGKKQLHTTRTWEFMGFPQQTDKINTGSDVIIGVIDTGIWPESDSFDDTGFGPPPVHLPNLQHYLQQSDGIYGPRDFVSPRDSEGHGTHVASTAAGGMVNTAGLMGLAAGTARGAVPSARLAIYKACWSGFCEDADILAAFDDAIAGGVNIVSLSAGGDSPLYYFNNSIAIGSFHAMRHGILTSTSAGNDGPTFGTIGDYSPWQLSVAASTIDRKFFTKLKLGNGRVYQAEKERVARAAILASLENTLFDVYSSDAYTAKVLWDKLDQTHNTDSQGFEKYYVARFLDFKLVDGKSMTEQVHEFEITGAAQVQIGTCVACGTWELEESSDLWHLRLGHLNFGALKNMMNLELIPKYAIDKKSKCQDEALDKFIMYKNETETQTDKVLKRLRSDRGGEYTSTLFNEFCASNDIVHEVTPPYTPESNGVAERKNRTFKDMINSMLINSGLPKYMWGEALNTAGHILNRVPLKHMDKTPYELWRKRRTSLSYLRVWGCLAKVLVPEHKRKKPGPKTVDCIFLGYLETTTARRFLVLKSDIDGIVANTIVEFRDATFFEEVFPMKTGISLGSSEDDPTHTSSSIPDHVEKMTNVGVDPGSSSTPNKVEEPRKSKRAKVVKDFGSDFITYNIEDEPLTFRQAKDSSESRHWKGALKSEIDSIVSNRTWELVDLPPGCSTIGCKWIFKRKLNHDGSINKYKARLVAKGFRQREGIDYFDTYSPVARMTTIRMLIALASVHGLIIHQMDVKTTFLHGDLEEEIYTDQPEGFVASDDILLFGTNIEIINKTKSFLKMHFEMKDMGEASVILGIKLTQSTDGITLSHSHYIEKSILEKYSYSNCRIASTPYDSKVSLVKNSSGVPVSQLRYTSCPNKTHWEALDRVLRYLKGTISLGLHYRRFPGVLEGYSDASWIAKKSGSNGVTGYVFTLAGGAVS